MTTLVYGLAVAGRSTAKFLAARGKPLLLADDRVSTDNAEFAASLGAELVEGPEAAMACAKRKVKEVNAAKGKDKAQKGTENGWATMRLNKGKSHINTNAATPQMACTHSSGASNCTNDKPMTEGGAKLMNHEGKMRSGNGL